MYFIVILDCEKICYPVLFRKARDLIIDSCMGAAVHVGAQSSLLAFRAILNIYLKL